MTDSAHAVRPARPRTRLARDIALALALAAAGPAAVKLAPWLGHMLAKAPAAPVRQPAHTDHPATDGRVRAALRQELGRPETSDLAAVYAARDHRPIWIVGRATTRDAQTLLTLLAQAGQEGLDPRRYRVAELQARLDAVGQASPSEMARTDIALSSAFAGYAVDFHTPGQGSEMIVTDPVAATGPATRRDALAGLAGARSASAWMAGVQRMNPIYVGFRAALARWRTQHSDGGGDPRTEQLLRLNMDRARALPADPARRWILVDVAAQQLRLYEDGQPRGAMKVVVGRPDLQTPIMSGVIRYAVLNPYWNVPPDLTRNRFAPRAAVDPHAVDAEHMEVLTDWRPGAALMDPTTLDWSAVERGEQTVWLRQKPGPDNMMGRIKFMLPNTLGIYLHDTPAKALFKLASRTRSAGCVRVEDPPRLAAWLFVGHAPKAGGSQPEQRVDLPSPVPVYMAYFTAMPKDDGALQIRPDVYHRDPVGLQALAQRGRL